MGRINVDLEMPLDGVFRETKHICRPVDCVTCLMYFDEHVPWCSYYKRRTVYSGKPEWCKIIVITVSEDL